MNAALWFFDHNVRVFPIVVRGKTPACSSWDDYTCTRAQAAQFKNYGVRLGRLGVADSDNPNAEAWVAVNLPTTPFMVKTARGVHRYYRLDGQVPAYIHRDGLTIEFRRRGQYTVGPGSVHPSGVIYTASDWSWRWNDIPLFPTVFIWDDRPSSARSANGASFVLPPKIYAGERHDLMFRVMRSLQARGVGLDGVLAVCRLENHAKCQPELDHDELDRFITRAYREKDTAGFIRTPQTAWELFGGLFEVGLSADAVLLACHSIDPDFDPEKPEPVLEPETPTVEWDLDSPGGSI